MNNINPRHQPIKFDKYQEIHHSYIRFFVNDGFVGNETLDFQPDLDEITLKGEIACLGQIVIRVYKTLIITSGSGEGALVQTSDYEYNVSVRGLGNVFRYDNSHEREGHSDNHHKHEFNWRVNEQGEGRVTWIGVAGWPTLGDVIAEAREWYWCNFNELPQDYPDLGLR